MYWIGLSHRHRLQPPDDCVVDAAAGVRLSDVFSTDRLLNGKRFVAIDAPTGCGKTHLVSLAAQAFPDKKIMVIVFRRSLVKYYTKVLQPVRSNHPMAQHALNTSHCMCGTCTLLHAHSSFPGPWCHYIEHISVCVA